MAYFLVNMCIDLIKLTTLPRITSIHFAVDSGNGIATAALPLKLLSAVM